MYSQSNAYSCNHDEPVGDIHPGIIKQLTSQRVGNKTDLQVQARAIHVRGQKAKSCKNPNWMAPTTVFKVCPSKSLLLVKDN